jgi:uncharacterized protein (TIGR02001 family)
MKHTTLLSVLTLTAASALAQSAAPAPAYASTGNLALTSNYVFRGVSYSADHLAVQGGFDLTKTPVNGLTAGVWASSLDAGTEVDLYANYGFKLGAVDVSVGYIDYTYSASSAYATGGEANVSATYAGVTLKVSKGVSGALSDYYYEANYTHEISQVKGLSLGLHYGNDRASKKDDYTVSLTYPVLGFDASVAYNKLEGSSALTAFTVKKSF